MAERTIKALIVEDETGAALNLKTLLAEVEPAIEIAAVIDTVTDAVNWFANNSLPDIVFMDIHLADGDAFNIFNETDISCPVIFTTAYDQYALEAFKVNSVDYILKPIKSGDLCRALDKIKRLSLSEKLNYIERVNRAGSESAPKPLLVHFRDKLIPLEFNQIAFCYTSEDKVSAYCGDGRIYTLDKTLDAMISVLPGDTFFRANRQFIVNRAYIKDISVWLGSRVSVNLNAALPEKIIISRAKVKEFKKWLTGT